MISRTLLAPGHFLPVPAGRGRFRALLSRPKPEVTKDFVVDDAVIAQLRKYLAEQHIRLPSRTFRRISHG